MYFNSLGVEVIFHDIFTTNNSSNNGCIRVIKFFRDTFFGGTKW